MSSIDFESTEYRIIEYSPDYKSFYLHDKIMNDDDVHKLVKYLEDPAIKYLVLENLEISDIGWEILSNALSENKKITCLGFKNLKISA